MPHADAKSELLSDEQIANAASEIEGKFEIEALVAYLQQLGTVISEKR